MLLKGIVDEGGRRRGGDPSLYKQKRKKKKKRRTKLWMGVYLKCNRNPVLDGPHSGETKGTRQEQGQKKAEAQIKREWYGERKKRSTRPPR